MKYPILYVFVDEIAPRVPQTTRKRTLISVHLCMPIINIAWQFVIRHFGSKDDRCTSLI